MCACLRLRRGSLCSNLRCLPAWHARMHLQLLRFCHVEAVQTGNDFPSHLGTTIQHTTRMAPGPVCQQQQMRRLPSQGEQLKQTPCRVLYEDSANNVFMWDERGSLIAIPDFTGPLETAVWALDMPGIFALSDVLQLHLYAYLPNTLSGPGAPGPTQRGCHMHARLLRCLRRLAIWQCVKSYAVPRLSACQEPTSHLSSAAKHLCMSAFAGVV